MRIIKAQPLTKEAFAPYGEYYAMDKPSGYSLNGEIYSFFPDRISGYQGHNVAFSPLLVNKPESMLITQVEYHSKTCEMILPLNDDMILHVAEPSNGKPIPERTKAFIVPKNTLVKIKACVWHMAPLPISVDQLSVIIVLPECTYINDCKVVDFSAEEKFLIEL